MDEKINQIYVVQKTILERIDLNLNCPVHYQCPYCFSNIGMSVVDCDDGGKVYNGHKVTLMVCKSCQCQSWAVVHDSYFKFIPYDYFSQKKMDWFDIQEKKEGEEKIEVNVLSKPIISAREEGIEKRRPGRKKGVKYGRSSK